MNPFKAFRIHELDGRIVGRFDDLTLDDLGPGEVVVRVEYSDINYKDALAATGAGRILRKYPLVGGIDLAGVVVGSSDPRYAAGQHVLVTGCGLSETHDGGYAEYARLKGEWVIPLPPGMSTMDVMKLGTAGFTAALAIHRMEHNGQTPAKGPVVVTGATGGVGSIAINMLAGRGYEVVAVSGKPEADDYLRELGASRILRRQEIDLGSKPMETDPVGRRDRQCRRRVADLAHAHRGPVGQHREHRPRGQRRSQHDGDAVHPARREPARHQLLGDAARDRGSWSGIASARTCGRASSIGSAPGSCRSPSCRRSSTTTSRAA